MTGHEPQPPATATAPVTDAGLPEFSSIDEAAIRAYLVGQCEGVDRSARAAFLLFLLNDRAGWSAYPDAAVRAWVRAAAAIERGEVSP